MEKLTSKKAIELLFKDVIKENNDILKPENRWIMHCLHVGYAAGRIAKKLELDEDYALALGFIHDIGRKISHPKHPIEGYEYMKKCGFEKEGEICLTHSFINNDINLVAGGAPSDSDEYLYIDSFLKGKVPNIYDNIVKLCDLFCLDKGFTTVEKRILDVYSRKGIYQYSKEHFEATLKLKEVIEKELECSLYELFPEISKEDINSINEDSNKIMQMILESKKIIKKY